MNEGVNTVTSKPAYRITVMVKNVPVKFTLDTGCGVPLIDETMCRTYFSDYLLIKCNTTLCSFSGHEIETLGEFSASAGYNAQHVDNLHLIVVTGSRPALLCWEWLSVIKLNWAHVVCNITTKPESDVTHLLSKHSTVFEGGFGKIQDHAATVVLKPNAKSKHHKSRTVLYALCEVVAKELHNQVASGVLKPVDK